MPFWTQSHLSNMMGGTFLKASCAVCGKGALCVQQMCTKNKSAVVYLQHSAVHEKHVQNCVCCAKHCGVWERLGQGRVQGKPACPISSLLLSINYTLGMYLDNINSDKNTYINILYIHQTKDQYIMYAITWRIKCQVKQRRSVYCS